MQNFMSFSKMYGFMAKKWKSRQLYTKKENVIIGMETILNSASSNCIGPLPPFIRNPLIFGTLEKCPEISTKVKQPVTKFLEITVIVLVIALDSVT